VPLALGEAMEEKDESSLASLTQSSLAEAYFRDPTNFAALARTGPSAPLRTDHIITIDRRMLFRYNTEDKMF
jgi:hypothetical protein